jgi:hypothetical protein
MIAISENGSYLYFIEIFKVQNAILFSTAILKKKSSFNFFFVFLGIKSTDSSNKINLSTQGERENIILVGY